LNYLGKEKERLRIRGKESTHEGLLDTLLSSSILPKGSTGALEARGDHHSWAMETMKEA
jgi:hypothetical protein